MLGLVLRVFIFLLIQAALGISLFAAPLQETPAMPVLPNGSPRMIGNTGDVIWSDSSASSDIFNSVDSLWNSATGELKKLGIPKGFFLFKAARSATGLFLLGSEANNPLQKIVFITSEGKAISTNLPFGQSSLHLIVLTDQSALVMGGEVTSPKRFTNEVQRIVVQNGSLKVERLPDIPDEISHSYAVVALNDGRVMLLGGSNETLMGCFECVADTFFLDTKTKVWSKGPRMLEPRANGTATLLPDGSVLVTGGWLAGHNNPIGSFSTERWVPKENRFVSDTPLPIGIAGHRAIWVAGQQGKHLLLVGGMTAVSNANDAILDFEVATGTWRTLGKNHAVNNQGYGLYVGTLIFNKQVYLWSENAGYTGSDYFVALNIPVSSKSQTNPSVALPRGANALHKYQSNIPSDLLLAEANSGNATKVLWLVSQGADVNTKNDEGSSLLMLANHYFDIKSIQSLIDSGADINATNKDGSTELMLAIQSGRTDVVRALLTKDVNIQAKDKNGKNALMIALENDQLDLVQMLLAKGADVNVNANDGTTALMLAAPKGHPDVVQALLSKGADVNAKNSNGKTALMFASEKGQVEVVRALLAKGANINIKDNQGVAAIDMISKGNLDARNLLIKAGAVTLKKNPIWEGVWKGSLGKQDITACFQLDYDNLSVHGVYYYSKYRQPIKLGSDRDKTEADSNLTLKEENGTWDLVTSSDDLLTGTWSNKNKQYAMSLVRAPIANKEEIGDPCGSDEFNRGRKVVCLATGPAIDRALCEQPALRLLLDTLARRADRLQQDCNVDASRTPGSLHLLSHVQWLADVRAGFDRIEGVTAQDYFGSAFTQRADELAQALSSCAREPGRIVKQLRIDTVTLPATPEQDQPSSLPFFQTEPALVGERINDALYRDLLHIEAPLSSRDDAVRKALLSLPKPPPDEPPTNETLKVSVLWRTPGFLVLQVNTSGCETRCWQNSEQRLFDLRTGDGVSPDDLLSPEGRRALNLLGKSSVLQEMRKLRRSNKAQWGAEGLAAFDRCVQEWGQWRPTDGSQILWFRNGRWQLEGAACTGDDDAMPPSIDSKIFAVTALTPYLSAYGKSLVLGHGDVRTPEQQMAVCRAEDALPDPQGWAARVADISAGEDHFFLREASGRVWAWGSDSGGQCGCGNQGAPFVIGDDYLYAGAGQGFSAAVRRDGSLWTWGSGYMGRLGDGGESRRHPVLIGKGFTQADVDNAGGRALARDGLLWAWGDSERPNIRVVARDVTQVRGSIPVLMIRRDGGLWAWNEWEWTPPGASAPTPEVLHWHGAGFERLPRSRKVELAWRADGTAWAWGKTLAAMATPEVLLGMEQNSWPRLVGHDWVDVKTSEDSTLIAARKADGSLWVSQQRGTSVHMEPLGCGFSDMAFAYDEAHGIHLLALRSDGRLLDYHSSKRDDANVRRDLIDRKPQILANGGLKLFQENDYGGNVGSKVFLLSQDGTLWEWYWSFGDSDKEVPTDHWLRKIDFPDAWFHVGDPQQGNSLKKSK